MWHKTQSSFQYKYINTTDEKEKKIEEETKEYTHTHQRLWSQSLDLDARTAYILWSYSAHNRESCGWILYTVIVVGFAFAEFKFVVGFFSFQVLLFFLFFVFFSLQSALYFVHHIYVCMYTIFSNKRNDKYSARVPLKNRFSSLILLIFVFFPLIFFFAFFLFASFDRCRCFLLWAKRLSFRSIFG